MNGRRFLVSIALTGLLTGPAWAGRVEAPADSAGAPGRVDRVQAGVSQGVVAATRWADRFFGDTSELEEARYSYLRLQGALRWIDGEGWKFRPSVRLKADFPNTSRRWSLLFSGSGEDDEFDITGATDESAELGLLEEPGENNSFAALNFAREIRRSRFDLRVGMKSSWRPFTELRYRLELFPEQRLYGRLTESLSWVAEDGVGLTSRVEFNYQVSPPLLLRWPTRITISETSSGFEWFAGFTLVHRLSGRTSVSYDTGVSGNTEPFVYARNYAVSARLRRDMRAQWLYFELAPEVTWPKRVENGESRRTTPGVQFKLEVFLGEREAHPR